MFQPEALKTDQPLLWSVGTGTAVWELLHACARGDLATVQQSLGQNPALVRSHYAYRTPIYFAVRENHLPVARFLLARGADVLSLAVNDSLLQITRDRGYTEMEALLQTHLAEVLGASVAGEPVAAAIRDRDLDRVRALLDAAPELISAGDLRGNRPIHWAAMTRQLPLIDELLARGADINQARPDGARPIHLSNGDYHYRGWRDVPKDVATTPAEVFAHLAGRGAFVDLGMAAAAGDLDRVRALVDQDPSSVNRVSEYNSYYIGCGAPLKNAAATGQLEIVRFLLERGADPNLPEEGIAPRGHALYSAVANGHHAIARLLLEHGAVPNAPVESSADTLSRALSREDREMVELLCSYGAARSVDLLAHYNDLQTAAAVFAANPQLADDPDALGSAASEAFVRLVLRYQPDLPKRTTVIKPPGIARLLFRHGMEAGRPDWLGVTPLHELARQGNLELAALYLEHGASLNARDEDICSTPLGWAAKFGQAEMAKFLLARGSRRQLPDDPPWATPLSWATRRGHTEIAGLLS